MVLTAETKETLRTRATERYGEAITPCADKTREECFTVEGNCLYFWFNDVVGSTHLISVEMKEPS